MKTWKRREAQVSEFFDGRGRTPLSGRNSKHTASDILHDTLFVEHKHRKRHAVLRTWDAAAKLAKEEGKIPAVTLSEEGRTGFWIVCHSTDLTAIANQRSKIRSHF